MQTLIEKVKREFPSAEITLKDNTLDIRMGEFLARVVKTNEEYLYTPYMLITFYQWTKTTSLMNQMGSPSLYDDEDFDELLENLQCDYYEAQERLDD